MYEAAFNSVLREALFWLLDFPSLLYVEDVDRWRHLLGFEKSFQLLQENIK
jgi:hypothetical protein